LAKDRKKGNVIKQILLEMILLVIVHAKHINALQHKSIH